MAALLAPGWVADYNELANFNANLRDASLYMAGRFGPTDVLATTAGSLAAGRGPAPDRGVRRARRARLVTAQLVAARRVEPRVPARPPARPARGDRHALADDDGVRPDRRGRGAARRRGERARLRPVPGRLQGAAQADRAVGRPGRALPVAHGGHWPIRPPSTSAGWCGSTGTRPPSRPPATAASEAAASGRRRLGLGGERRRSRARRPRPGCSSASARSDWPRLHISRRSSPARGSANQRVAEARAQVVGELGLERPRAQVGGAVEALVHVLEVVRRRIGHADGAATGARRSGPAAARAAPRRRAARSRRRAWPRSGARGRACRGPRSAA